MQRVHLNDLDRPSLRELGRLGGIEPACHCRGRRRSSRSEKAGSTCVAPAKRCILSASLSRCWRSCDENWAPTSLRRNISNAPVPPGRRHDPQHGFATTTSSGTHVSDKSHPELGYRRQGWRPERLVGLHHLASVRQTLLSGSDSRALRVSSPSRYGHCAGQSAAE